MSNACQRAEVLAGAIALDEAVNAELEEFRAHIAVCSSCLQTLGGEIGIRRVMDTIREARESETWQPVLASIHAKHERRLRALIRFTLATTGIAIATAVAIRLLVVTSIGPVAVTPSNPIVFDYDGTHFRLEHRPAVRAKGHVAPSAAGNVLVVHNVITLKAPVARTQVTHSANSVLRSTTTVVAQALPPAQDDARDPQLDVPVWRRGDPLPASPQNDKGATASLHLEGRAESIALAPVQSVRDVAPLGGESAINPQPPMIAYSEGAEGTTAFAVSVDERGVPVKCTITQSSSSVVLDEAVCKAAMKARFAPRMVNGRAMPSVYRDAFTFRNQTNNEGIEQPIPN